MLLPLHCKPRQTSLTFCLSLAPQAAVFQYYISIHLFPSLPQAGSPPAYPDPSCPLQYRAGRLIFPAHRASRSFSSKSLSHLKSLAIPTITRRRLTKRPSLAVLSPDRHKQATFPHMLPTLPFARSETAIDRAENEIVPPDRRPGSAWGVASLPPCAVALGRCSVSAHIRRSRGLSSGRTRSVGPRRVERLDAVLRLLCNLRRRVLDLIATEPSPDMNEWTLRADSVPFGL